MPLIPPTVDDLRYDTVEPMLRERIPLVAPEWTDHNETDPGIALIQLFAHLTEQLGYRLNRVPDKTYVEFLKLVGLQLEPAKAAETRIAFTLGKPGEARSVLVPAGMRINARGTGGAAPVFETDANLDVLPAQLAALVTTKGGLLNINGAGESGPAAAGVDPVKFVDERFSLAWDGKAPKLKDMPLQPVALFTQPQEAGHRVVNVGLAFNKIRSAGFLGSRARLHLQIHSDETPEPDDQVHAGAPELNIANAFAEGPPLVFYEYYRPPAIGEPNGTWQPLTVLADETDGWTRSGSVRFDVPETMGAVPDGGWIDVETDMAHPLVDALKTPVTGAPEAVPVSGWIRVTFGLPPQIRVRSLSFNTMTATNLQTVVGERLAQGTGLSAQTMTLAHQNVERESLQLVSRDRSRVPEYLSWRLVEDFDGAGPDDPVYALDPEAGIVIFGDGYAGRPPFATERMIAERYRHGGGEDGNVDTGAAAQPEALPADLSGAFNLVPARGGRPAETLEEAKRRAPAAFRRRDRAVTADDFRDAALEAPGAEIARAETVARHIPYAVGHQIGGLDAPGIDFATETPGAVTVIAVPDAPGAYPMPTTGELTAVAAHLDSQRLLTTELHVTTPQYVRIFGLTITVKAAPGYSEAVLREAIIDNLCKRFHILTGGPDGRGYPFGAPLHHADLVAETMAVAGVARVEGLDAAFDGRSPASAERAIEWRVERRTPVRLTNCPDPEDPAETDRIVLMADEALFIDAAAMLVSVVGTP